MKKIILGIIAVIAIFCLAGCGEEVTIYNNANDVVEDSKEAIDNLAGNIFNDQFTMYLGDNVKASNVKSLIRRVEVNNKNENTFGIVELEGISTIADVVSSHQYMVTAEYGSNGLINKIVIVDNTPADESGEETNEVVTDNVE